MSEEKFSFESIKDRDSVVQLLESITQGFKDGSIVLATEKKSIELNPQGLLDFTIKAKQKSKETKLEMRIRWKEQSNKKDGKARTLSVGRE